MCLVPRSDEFECQGQRSRSLGTKTRCALPSSPPAATEWNALAANAAANETIRSLPGVIAAAYVRFMFGKTSLALVNFFVGRIN